MKKIIASLLCIALVMACFVGCSKNSKGDKTPEKDNTTQEYNAAEDKQAANNGTENKEEVYKGDSSQAAKPWIVDAVVTDEFVSTMPFYEDLAFVTIRTQCYFIDRMGNLKITLEDYHMSDHSIEECRFYNGLFYVSAEGAEGYFIDKEGKKITAQDLGGTAFNHSRIFYELLEAGYIVVDKVTSDYAGATYESAVYNTKLEQVQPYSAQLYELFHNQYIEFYNGYVYYDEYQTYHIATNTYAQYDVFPKTYVNKFDFAHFSERSSDERGFYRNNELLLDLSHYKTLVSVEFVGELGLALFCNEQNERYFSLMDMEGNLKFDPIQFGDLIRHADGYGVYCWFNGSVILATTHTALDNGKYQCQIRTYDLQGKELGILERTTTDWASNYYNITLGEDTLVIYGVEECWYNEKLEPLFPTE